MHENDKYPGVPERIQLMDENGTVHEHRTFSRYVKDVDGDTLREAYRLMYTTRRFDDEATALQRQGQLALWVPSRGQEAAQVGSALAYAPNDYIFPSYREHAVALARGVDFRDLITIFRGTTTHGWDMKAHNFHTYTKVLAAQTLHAVGYAMGLNFDADIEAETGKRPTGQGQATDPATDAQKPAVAVYFGDGSSSEGDVHESMVFAASYDAPVLFFVQNNRWAISVPFEVQSRVPISTRAPVTASRACAWTAMTSWACSPQPATPWRRSAPARAPCSSRPRPTAWARTPPPTTPRSTAPRPTLRDRCTATP